MTKTNKGSWDRWAEKAATFLVMRPWVAVFLTVCMLSVAAVGLKDLQVSTNYRAFFGPGNAELKAFEAFEDTYTRNDNFLFALQAEGEAVISRRTLEAAADLTREAWQIPFAIRVDSITNFQNSYAEGDDLTVVDLFPSPANMSDDAIAKALATAVSEPLLNGKLIDATTATVGVNVTLQYSGENLEEVTDATAVARALKTRIEGQYPGVRVAMSGVSALNNAFAEATISDAVTLFPVMFLALVVVIWIAVRSIAGTLAALMVVMFSTVAAMGFAGFAGIAISPFSGSAPVVILTLALADCMHIFVSVKALRRKGVEKAPAIILAYKENLLAVTVTSLTTVVGFLALNFSDAPPFNDLGNIVAVGIGFAWILSLTFFPAFLAMLPMGEPKEGIVDRLIDKKLQFVSALVSNHARATLAVGALVLVILGLFIPRIDLNDPWVNYFDEKVEFRGDTEFVMDNLTGLYLVEFSIPSAGPGQVNSPDYLAILDDFSSWLRTRGDVSHVQSYADIIKRINRNMNGDDPSFYSIPETRETASQYLLLYELSLPYGLDMNDRINIDRSASRMTVTLPEISTRGVRDFVEEASAWMAENAPAEMAPIVTGAPVLFAHISERNISDMFSGNLVAVLLIALIICITLRSIGFGVLSLIPNIVPIIATFGIWALLVGEVGMAAATVSATSLGIIVDNTVHILVKFRYAREKRGLGGRDAVQYALDTVGHAVLVNTIVLVVGFGVLALSTFRVTGQMGSLTALVIAVAFFVDLILLPAVLLFVTDRKNQTHMKGSNDVAKEAA